MPGLKSNANVDKNRQDPASIATAQWDVSSHSVFKCGTWTTVIRVTGGTLSVGGGSCEMSTSRLYAPFLRF